MSIISKVLLHSITVSAVAVMVISCGGKATQGSSAAPSNQRAAESPFRETFEAPCSSYGHDDDEWFAAIGIANGPRTRMDVIQQAALTNAQNIIRQKMQHAYEGVVINYGNYIGNNAGTDADARIRSGGTQIIDRVIRDTRTVCGPKFSSVDEKGQVNSFIAIRISKQEVAAKLSNHVESVVSDDERMRIMFEESKFREEMESSLRRFRENN